MALIGIALSLEWLLRLVPDSLARHLAPLPETRGASTIRDLLHATFEGRDTRARYEAQRKLYLAKLLFDIDHSRSVRDGPKHRARFEAIVKDALFSEVTREDEVEVFGILERGPDGSFRLNMERQPRPGARSFRFRPRRLPAAKASSRRARTRDRDLPLSFPLQARSRP